MRHCEEKHRLNRSISTAADGSFVQSWPVCDAAMGRKFQNWFVSTCTRASFDGNVFISRLLKKDAVRSLPLTAEMGRIGIPQSSTLSPL